MAKSFIGNHSHKSQASAFFFGQWTRPSLDPVADRQFVLDCLIPWTIWCIVLQGKLYEIQYHQYCQRKRMAPRLGRFHLRHRTLCAQPTHVGIQRTEVPAAFVGVTKYFEDPLDRLLACIHEMELEYDPRDCAGTLGEPYSQERGKMDFVSFLLLVTYESRLSQNNSASDDTRSALPCYQCVMRCVEMHQMQLGRTLRLCLRQGRSIRHGLFMADTSIHTSNQNRTQSPSRPGRSYLIIFFLRRLAVAPRLGIFTLGSMIHSILSRRGQRPGAAIFLSRMVICRACPSLEVSG